MEIFFAMFPMVMGKLGGGNPSSAVSVTSNWELEENTDDWQLEDGSGNWILE